MTHLVRRPSGLLVPPEPRMHRPEYCELLGFDAVGAAGAGVGGSAWKGYTGTADGPAQLVMGGAYSYVQGSEINGCANVIMLSDSYGIAVCADGSSSVTNENVSALRFVGFSVSGTTITVGTPVSAGANYYYPNRYAGCLAAVDGTRALFVYGSHGASPTLDSMGRVLTLDLSTLAVTVGPEYPNYGAWSPYGVTKLQANKYIYSVRQSPILVTVSGTSLTFDTLIGGDPYSPYGYQVSRTGTCRIDDTHFSAQVKTDNSTAQVNVIQYNGGGSGSVIGTVSLNTSNSGVFGISNLDGTLGYNYWNGTNYDIKRIDFTGASPSISTTLVGGAGTSGAGSDALLDNKSTIGLNKAGNTVQVNIWNFENNAYTRIGPVNVHNASALRTCMVAPFQSGQKAVVVFQDGSNVYLKVLNAA